MRVRLGGWVFSSASNHLASEEIRAGFFNGAADSEFECDG